MQGDKGGGARGEHNRNFSCLLASYTFINIIINHIYISKTGFRPVAYTGGSNVEGGRGPLRKDSLSTDSFEIFEVYILYHKTPQNPLQLFFLFS